MKTNRIKSYLLAFSLTLGLAAAGSAQIGNWDPKLPEKAEKTLNDFMEKDPNIEEFVKQSFAYAVFPSIGKGGVGIGGAHGRGVVYQDAEIIGNSKMTQVTVGLQWGGQAYSELLFFENEAAFERFKTNELKLAAQASAIALDKGVSTDVAYEDGVAIFTLPKKGLMYEASIGGQVFKFWEVEK